MKRVPALALAALLWAARPADAGDVTVTDPAAPDWGRDDVWTWAGRAAMKSGDSKGAVEAYRKALAANPNNGWVRHSLLPEAEKKVAAN